MTLLPDCVVVTMGKSLCCWLSWHTTTLVMVGRYEVEKLTASQRLDLNLEKGRMRDELQVGSAAGLPGM